MIARDSEGNKHLLKVWSETDRSVFLASEDLFRRLERGQRDCWPVAVPKEDVKPVRGCASRKQRVNRQSSN